jgi:tripartite-type tricarboxylate transporter receptor subunit TctC
MRALLGSILALGLLGAPAAADTIRIVIPYAPGGALDPLARILANGLGKLRPNDGIVVENIGGAAGMIGMNTVAKAAPDGRTLLFSPSGNIVISPWLQANLPYDPVRAFAPVVQVGSVKSALVVRASLDAHSLAGLIALAKSGVKLTFGSPGIGTSPHISGAMLNQMAGIDITHVPFRGLGPALNDLLGGHIDVLTTSVIGVLPYVEAKTARALAVLDAARSEQLREVPTTAELGFRDLVMPQWYAVLAPAGLPRATRDRLEAQALAVLRSPEVAAQLALSGVANPQGADALAAVLDAEFKKWPLLLPKLGIHME